jgi:hypothetical protein
MENLFNYISKQVDPEEVDIWFKVNNIIPEKMELYYDFCYSLFSLMVSTYLGGTPETSETGVIMNDDDNLQHFRWCWSKNIENFKREEIDFNNEGEHFDYFYSLFSEVFYSQKREEIRNSINDFFDDLFNREKPFTQVDLDLVYNLYKSLDKNILI